MIKQFSIDVQFDGDEYSIPKLANELDSLGYDVLGIDVTASWENLEKYEHNEQDC